MEKQQNIPQDLIVEIVKNRLQERSEKGIKKYGTTMDRDDLSIEQWIDHAIEESLDHALYLTKLRKEIANQLTFLKFVEKTINNESNDQKCGELIRRGYKYELNK